ncbi:MAG TPA: TrmH family RNA methyltransferase [Candidatus Limnocylindrales bacterium]
MTVLTSAANPRIKAALSLRERRDRERTGLTIVDGVREIDRALRAGIDVVELFAAPERCTTPECRSLLDRVPGWTAVAPTLIDRLAYGDRADGAVAVVRAPSIALGDLRLPGHPLLVVLEAVEKPGNVGAVLRTADAAGADALLLADARTDPFNPNVIRASLGTAFSVAIGVGAAGEVRAFLRERSIRIVAARVDAPVAYPDVDLRGAVAIVLGSEASGLSGGWAGEDVIPVRLPMHGVADSLNVSVTAGILLYEAQRQRST